MAGLGVFLDDHLVLEVSATGIPGHLRGLLEHMDDDMDQGIRLDGEMIPSPDAAQRVRYVTGRLLSAVTRGEQQAARVMCSYLARREPALRRLDICENGSSWSVRLAYD